MAILGNTTINGSLNINGIPVEPGAGTLKTDNSGPLPITTESLGGTVNLHKISKTGRYTDLIGSAEAVVATTQHVQFTTTIDNNNFTLSEGGLYNIFLNEGVSSNVYNPTALGTRYLLLAQNDPAQNGLFERIGSSGIDYLFTRVTNQPVVIIREGHNKFKIYKMNGNGVWEGSPTSGSSEILQVTCTTPGSTPAKEVVDASRVPVAGDIVIVTFTNGNSASNPTLNINSSGAKYIRLGTTNASTTTMTVGAGGVVPLYFDGTYYNMFGSYRTSDSNTYDRMYHSVNKRMGETLYRYKLILEGIDGKFYPIVTTNQTSTTLVQKTPTNATLKIGGNILYYNTTTTVAADGLVNNTYSEISTTNMVYSFNQNGGYQLQRPIYLVGILQAGGGYKLDSNYYTQDLPTTEDGKIYIQLGIVYAENCLRLETGHPIYEFKDGKVRPYVAEHTHTISQITDFPILPSKATQTQAEAGTDNTTYMTPLRVKQSILANLPQNPGVVELKAISAGAPNGQFVPGDLYYDTLNKKIYKYSDKQWVFYANNPTLWDSLSPKVEAIGTVSDIEYLEQVHPAMNLSPGTYGRTRDPMGLWDGTIFVVVSNSGWVFGAYPELDVTYLCNEAIYMYNGVTLVPVHDVATKTEAESGTDNIKHMTPLRVKQAIDKNLASDVTIGGNLNVTGITEFNDEVYFKNNVENGNGEMAVFSPAINTIVKLTQAQYNALSSKSGTTLYIIVG